MGKIKCLLGILLAMVFVSDAMAAPCAAEELAWAGQVTAPVKVVALTGTADDNTPQLLAQKYVSVLSGQQVDARFVSIPNATHNSALRLPCISRSRQ